MTGWRNMRDNEGDTAECNGSKRTANVIFNNQLPLSVSLVPFFNRNSLSNIVIRVSDHQTCHSKRHGQMAYFTV